MFKTECASTTQKNYKFKMWGHTKLGKTSEWSWLIKSEARKVLRTCALECYSGLLERETQRVRKEEQLRQLREREREKKTWLDGEDSQTQTEGESEWESRGCSARRHQLYSGRQAEFTVSSFSLDISLQVGEHMRGRMMMATPAWSWEKASYLEKGRSGSSKCG